MSGINATKLNEQHLRAEAKKLKIKDHAEKPLKELAKDVATELAKKHADKSVLACTECGFPSPDVEAIARCPGCGAAFNYDEEPKELKGSKKKEGSKKDEPEGTPANPEVLAPIATSKDAAIRLEGITAEIRTLRDNIALNGWTIGHRLRDVHDNNLWVGQFASFADYVEKQCGFSRTTGQDFIRVARAYPTEESVKGLTISTLKYLAKVEDPEVRAAMTEKARTEQPTKKELAEEVRDHKKREYQQKVESGEKVDGRTRPVRAGFDGKVVLKATLEEGSIVHEGTWKTWDKGSGKGRFQIGEVTFEIEVKARGEGFKITVPKSRKK